MKRMLSFLLVVLLLGTSLPQSVLAANPVTVYVHGKLVVADQLPYIQEGRVMLPFRAIGEQLGATVTWDEQTQQISFQNADNVVLFHIGSYNYTHNGVVKSLDMPPQLKGDRTFVPVRFISEALGYPVVWNDIRRSAYVGVLPDETLDPGKPMVALTFDDGPAAGKTERIVQALANADGRATFFMVGSSVQNQPNTVWQVAAHGNEIGNHSFSHADFTKLAPSGIQFELSSADQAIAAVVGEAPTLIRPTYGSVNQTFQNSVNRPLILWSIDPEDWRTRDTAASVNHVMAHVKDGSIILLHDIHEPTVLAALELIPKLKAQGYQLVTVTELMASKGITGQPGGLVSYG